MKAGAEYPAILFMTAETDTRVDPMHAKKMAALMQAEAKNGASRDASDPTAHREQGRTRRGQAGDEADRGIYGYLFVFVLAGREISTQYSVPSTQKNPRAAAPSTTFSQPELNTEY